MISWKKKEFSENIFLFKNITIKFKETLLQYFFYLVIYPTV